MQNTPTYWSYRSDRKLSDEIHRILTNEDEINGRLDAIVANTFEGGLLLEAGCGTGAYVHAVSASNRSCIGLDFNDELLKGGRSLQPSPPFVQGSILNLPFADNLFDGYLSFGLIEHFVRGDQEQIVREALRVLKEGGKAIVTVPNLYSLNTLTRPIKGLFRERVWQRNMSRNQVQSLFEGRGFRTVEAWNAEVRYDLLKSLGLKRSRLARRILFPIADCLEHISILGYNTYYVGEKS